MLGGNHVQRGFFFVLFVCAMLHLCHRVSRRTVPAYLTLGSTRFLSKQPAIELQVACEPLDLVAGGIPVESGCGAVV